MHLLYHTSNPSQQGDFFNPCYSPDMSGMLAKLGEGVGKMKQDWSGGSGPYPAQYTTDPSLPNHTIYAPKHVVSNKKMPLIVWANGGCGTDGSSFSNFLTEIASWGFMVVASGAPSKAWGTGGMVSMASMGGSEKSRASWLTQGIDWAEKGAAGGKYGSVDLTKIGSAGQSCGGVEAYSAAVYDPRVKVIGIHNTGVIDPGRRWMLKEIKQPIGYFYGGPSDFSESFVSLPLSFLE
jgi:hypothetical protein